MLRILLGILIAFLVKLGFYKVDYPDSIIILVLSSTFIIYKFLEDKKAVNLTKGFEDSIKKDLEDVKGSISALKIGRGINGR